MKEDRSLLMLIHLSQLVTLAVGFGSLLLPLIIWYTQRDKILDIDKQGKQIINFQISLIFYWIICIPLILLLGLGLIGFLILAVSSIVFPILNAIKVNNGEAPHYPFAFTVLK